MLIKLKKHLQNEGVVNMQDLNRRFSSDPEALRQMLGVWMQKGKVREIQRSDACGDKCQRCDPLLTELYEWCRDTG